MKILKARVRWKFQWMNDPELQILVDEIPEDLVYKKIEFETGDAFWFAEKDGYVSYYFESIKDRSGFYGRTFHLNTEDGPYDLVGPWSSRSAVANKYFEPKCQEVTFTADPEVWERGYTFYAGNITHEKMWKAVDLIDNVTLKLVKKHDSEEYLIPVLIENDCTHENYGQGRNKRCPDCKHKVYELEEKEDGS